MKSQRRQLRRNALVLFAPVLVVACAALPAPAGAQPDAGPRAGTGMRVLVMGEDSDPASVIRNSDIFKRVMAELKAGMQKHGYRMVDEEMIAAELGWKIATRRPKAELMEAAKLANAAARAGDGVRVLALFSIHAAKQDLGFASRVSARVDGELYDVLSNQFLGTFETPREVFPAPADCAAACIAEAVGERARGIAANLGDILGRKLETLQPAPGSPAATAAGGGAALITTYTVEMLHFDTREAMEIVGVMASEFPGYTSHSVISSNSTVRRYEYVTTASPTKMHEWLTSLLLDMGFNPDKDVEIALSGAEIRLSKLTSKAASHPGRDRRP